MARVKAYVAGFCQPGGAWARVMRILEGGLERKMGFEPTTFSLARRCSTTEPLPLAKGVVDAGCAEGQSRTGDTGIFSAVLYHLSYLGINPNGTRPLFECQAENAQNQPRL